MPQVIAKVPPPYPAPVTSAAERDSIQRARRRARAREWAWHARWLLWLPMIATACLYVAGLLTERPESIVQLTNWPPRAGTYVMHDRDGMSVWRFSDGAAAAAQAWPATDEHLFGVVKSEHGSMAGVAYWRVEVNLGAAMFLSLFPLGLFAVIVARSQPPIPRPRVEPTRYCAACGYDLRATPERCPECGTVVDNAPFTPGSEP